MSADDTQPSHACDETPFPDDCLGCMQWERHWDKERAIRAEQQDADWWGPGDAS